MDGERQRCLKLTLPSSAPSALETVVEWVKEPRTAVSQRLGLWGARGWAGKGIWEMGLKSLWTTVHPRCPFPSAISAAHS